jgi:hypothetical protein
MKNTRVTNSVPSKNPSSINDEDPVQAKLVNMIKKQQQLLERIEFYIFKFEKKILEREENRRNQGFLGSKRTVPQVQNSLNESGKIKNTIKKILDLPKTNNNVRKTDKLVETVKPIQEKSEVKVEETKNVFDLNFSTNFESNYYNNNSANEEFDFFFQKNNINFEEEHVNLFEFDDK